LRGWLGQVWRAQVVRGIDQYKKEWKTDKFPEDRPLLEQRPVDWSPELGSFCSAFQYCGVLIFAALE
jgi:hypothetical protein